MSISIYGMVGTMTAALPLHRQMFVIYSALADPSIRKMSTVIEGAVLMVGSGYCLVGDRVFLLAGCSIGGFLCLVTGTTDGYCWLPYLLCGWCEGRCPLKLSSKHSISDHSFW